MTPGSFRVSEWRKTNRQRYNERQKLMMREKRKREREAREKQKEEAKSP